MSRQETVARVDEEPPARTARGKGHHGEVKPIRYEYNVVPACVGNNANGSEQICKHALEVCRSLDNAAGPLSWIYRRVVFNKGKPGPWDNVGTTCFTREIPDDGQQLTLAMIKEAWSHTAFAKPQVSIQPKGAKTLVHLETFFAAEWPEAGFKPGEVDTVTLLGHQVRIRPTLEQYDYDLGDGRHIGPTTSPGGPWPDGDITAEYDEPGHYPTQITVTYGGEFSVDGSDWGEIPGTLDIAGPVQELTVRTAPSRLVKD